VRGCSIAGGVRRVVHGAPVIMSGADIDGLGEGELEDTLDANRELIIARSSPETKLHVVDALRARGHTVAMTGDRLVWRSGNPRTRSPFWA